MSNHSSGAIRAVIEIMVHRALHQRDELAYIFSPDGESLKAQIHYGELDVAARALANALRLRAQPGDRVAITLPSGLDYLVALFACWHARLVPVPALPLRARRLSGMLSAICKDCDPRVIVCDTAASSAIAARALEDPVLAGVPRLPVGDVQPGCPDTEHEWRLLEPDDLALLQYTSGSTGRPKGVMVTHRNLVDNLEQARRRFAITAASRGVTWLPPHHDMGLVSGLLQPMYSGCVATVLSPLHVAQQPIRWLKAIDRARATISGGPPSAYELCSSSIGAQERESLDLSSWECAFVGAEPIPFAVLERFAGAFARNGFRRSCFTPCYGLAEATLMVTARPPGAGAARASAGDPRTTCGAAIEDHTVSIVDSATGYPAAEEQEGEVWIAGPSVAAGYWGDLQLTAETFQAFSALGDGPYLRTGDIGSIRNGELTISGRLKDCIILAGRKIHPEDVEQTVRDIECCKLRRCTIVAFTVEIDVWERVIIAIEPPYRTAYSTDEEAVIKRAISTSVLREHDVAVREIVFLKAGRLPRTSSGKIRRHLCAQVCTGEGALRLWSPH